MHVINCRNVNDAYFKGLQFLSEMGEHQKSRAGEVIVAPMPVTTSYDQPRERVLFDRWRDANPFFHLMEALWMLAGRNDATWLDQFVKDFSSRYAEDGTMHGAYGHRWRSHWWDDNRPGDPLSADFSAIDQLQVVIDLLAADPLDRRVVIQMWDPEYDLGAVKRDIPCNLCVAPRIVFGSLDITVFCRSNDAIWGAYGANAVHFSVLQEYLAAKIGIPVGAYYQISNNFHAYTDVFEAKFNKLHSYNLQPYDEPEIQITPIVTTPSRFDEDLAMFFRNPEPQPSEYVNPFFNNIAVPMFYSFKRWREGKRDRALDMITTTLDHGKSDWLVAARQWYTRRLKS